MTSLVSVMLTSFVLHTITESLPCDRAYQCAHNETVTGDGNVECGGYFSCYNVSLIQATTNRTIDCFASYGCFKANIVQRTNNKNTSSGLISCHGLYSCAFINYLFNSNGSILYGGEGSCFGSNIVQNSSANVANNDTVYCKGKIMRQYNN